MRQHTISTILQLAADSEAVIFDYDATIAKVPIDWPAARNGFREHMSGHGDEFGLDQVERVDEMEHAVLSKRPDLSEEVFAFRRSVETTCAGAHAPIERICDLIRQLDAQDDPPLHIISNNLQETVRSGLSQLGLESCFTSITGVDDAGLPKHHDAGLGVLQRQHAVDPAKCLFIGDNERTDGGFCSNTGIPFIHIDQIIVD